jgi:hypothetical protein
MSTAADTAGTYLVGRIEGTPLENEPFEHIELSWVFSPELYGELLANLPKTEDYREFYHRDAMMADGHSTRHRMFLYPEIMPFLPREQRAFWKTLSRALRSKEVQAAFKRKFRAALETRFGKNIDRLDFYLKPILVRDIEGYNIAIHPDAPRKAITVQFYLPRDMSQVNLGTHFHYGPEGEDAARVRAMQFAPSTGYAFPVLPGSWHSVPPTAAASGERNSLMMTYYVKDSMKVRLRFLRDRISEFWTYLIGRPNSNAD